jgi:hypothetical protein
MTASVEILRVPEDRLLKTDEDELVALIQWYAGRIHNGINFKSRVRRDAERLSGLVNALDQLGWFD